MPPYKEEGGVCKCWERNTFLVIILVKSAKKAMLLPGHEMCGMDWNAPPGTLDFPPQVSGGSVQKAGSQSCAKPRKKM